jgi:uncharacterized delta-60 repeat protein
MSIYECESCLTNEYKFIDGGSLPITIAGQPNVSFNIGSGFNGNINPIQIQSDGKILVGGNFSYYSGSSVGQGLIRLESDGTIDTSFDVGTGFYTNLYGDVGYISSIQIQSDGKIIVGGYFDEYSGTSVGNSLIRLESDGSIDTSFDVGTGFFDSFGLGTITSIQIQSDGKILVGGSFSSYSGVTRNRIIRLNTDGSVDTSFVVGTGFNTTVETIQLQPDGKILVCGFFTSYSGVSRNKIIRLNTDGSIDTSFVIGDGFNGIVNTIEIQPDGKILVGGTFSLYSGVSRNEIIRLNTDGSIDTSFVIGGGFSSTVLGVISKVSDIQLQPDGKILVGGEFTNYSGVTYNRIIRLDTDGSIDVSFVIGTGFNNQVNTIQLQPDNKILVGGNFTNYNEYSSGGICLINLNIVTPTIYSTDFRCYTPISYVVPLFDYTFKFGTGFNNYVSVIELQSDGKILVGGDFSGYSGVTRNRIIRLNTDGSIDESFIIGTGFDSTVRSIQLQTDGKILAGGFFSSYSGESYSRIIRLNTDGSIDTSFVIGTGFDNGVYTIQIQTDGKILVGGDFADYSGVSKYSIIRLNTDGSVDTSFVIGTGFNGTVNTIELQPDGKILVGGYLNSYNNTQIRNIVRLNEDGSLDNTFNVGYGFNFNVNSIVINNDEIIVGGDFTSYGRYDVGSLDINFNLYNPLSPTTPYIVYSSLKHSNNFIYVGLGKEFRQLNDDGSTQSQVSTNNSILSLEELSDSNLLLAGSFTFYNNLLNGGLVKVDTSGNEVAGFDVGYGFAGFNVYTTKELPSGKILVGGDFTVLGNSIFDISFNIGSGFNGQVLTAVEQPDGKILIGGNFTSYSGVSRSRIIRLNTDGSIDESFLVSGFSSNVNKIQIQSDGKIMVGGSFTSYGGTFRNRIIRLNTDGSIDTSFVIGGGFNNAVNAIQIQPDGKIMVGGVFSSYSGVSRNNAIRLNTDGSIDTSFVIGTGFSSQVNTIELQSDGKIIAGGGFTSYSGVSRNRIIRLNTDGSVDTSFVIGTGFNAGQVNAIQIQSDGKILAGGSTFITYSGVSRNRIVRLNTDGSIDTSFVIGVGFNNTVNTIGLRPDNKILVGGIFTTYSGVTINRIIGLNTDGSTDTSFVIGTGADSVVNGFIPKTGSTFVYGLFTTINGITQNRLSKVNYSGSSGVVVNRFTRLNSDGSYDTTFSANTGFASTVKKIDTQPDNKIIVAGDFTSYSGRQTNRIVRLNTDYTLDTSFSTTSLFSNIINDFEILSDGKILVGGNFSAVTLSNVGFSGGSTTVNDVSVQSDGKIIAGGDFTGYNSSSYNRIVRINSGGTIDNTFVIGSGFNDVVNGTQIQPDGKILVGGRFTTYSGVSRNRIIRLNTDGSVDTSFVIATGFDSYSSVITTQSDNKILVGGAFSSYSGVSRNRIIRLNTDGSVDTSFVVGTGFDSVVFTIKQQTDGKIVVGGFFTSYSGITSSKIIRLNTNGSIDNSFNIGLGFNSGQVNAIELQSDGKILVGGSFTSYSGVSMNYITRLNTDGSIDTSFVIGTGFNNTVTTIQLQPSGKILVGGGFTSYSGVTRNRIIRLNTDGSIDNSFVIGLGATDVIYNIANQIDGTIVAAGSFTFYKSTQQRQICSILDNGDVNINFNGYGVNGIARLNTDGTVDTTFVSGSGFTDGYFIRTINTIKTQSDGKIYVGGNFRRYNGNRTTNFVRLLSGGTYDNTFLVDPGFSEGFQFGVGTENEYAMVNTVLPISDQYVLVGGNYTYYQGFPSLFLSQLNLESNSGSTVNGMSVLNTDGTIQTIDDLIVGFNGGVYTIQLQPDGKLIVGGTFYSYNGIGRNNITRLNSDYSNDGSFNIGSGFNNTVSTIQLQPDGKILVGGGFTSYDGPTSNRIVRLLTSPNTAEYQAMFLYENCEECNGYIIPISANTEYDECRICDNVAVIVDPPHPVWTGLNGGAVTQMNAVLLGGNGLNS